MTIFDLRALCADLMKLAEESDDYLLRVPEVVRLVDRARAALAQPVGEGPSDEELLESAAKALGYKSIPSDETCLTAEASELLAFARAVLAHWLPAHDIPLPQVGEGAE